MSFSVGKRTEVKVTIYDKQYVLKKPTVGQARRLEKLSRDAKNDDEKFDLMAGFIGALGMPAEDQMDLELGHFQALVTYLCGTDSKN